MSQLLLEIPHIVLILAPRAIPLKQFPTSSADYAVRLEAWLQEMADKGYRYTGSITKVVGKQSFTVHTFTLDSQISKVKVLESGVAKILNYPTSEESLAESVLQSFTELAKQGWIYSGSYFKRISTSNYVFLVFYQTKKAKKQSKPGETEELENQPQA